MLTSLRELHEFPNSASPTISPLTAHVICKGILGCGPFVSLEPPFLNQYFISVVSLHEKNKKNNKTKPFTVSASLTLQPVAITLPSLVVAIVAIALPLPYKNHDHFPYVYSVHTSFRLSYSTTTIEKRFLENACCNLIAACYSLTAHVTDLTDPRLHGPNTSITKKHFHEVYYWIHKVAEANNFDVQSISSNPTVTKDTTESYPFDPCDMYLDYRNCNSSNDLTTKNCDELSRSQGPEIASGVNGSSEVMDVDGSIDRSPSGSQSQQGTIIPFESEMLGLNQHSAPSYSSPSTPSATPSTPVEMAQPLVKQFINANPKRLPKSKPQKQQKLTCQRCKISKRRCDGNSPCSSCLKGNRPCIPDSDRRRRINNSAITLSAPDPRIAQLEQTVEMEILRHDLETLRTCEVSLIEFLWSPYFKQETYPSDMTQFEIDVNAGRAPTIPDGLPLDGVSAPLFPDLDTDKAAFRAFLLKDVFSSKPWINLMNHGADTVLDADPLTWAILTLRRLFDMEHRQIRVEPCDQGGDEYIPRIRWPDVAMRQFLDVTIKRLSEFRQSLGQNVNMASE
ncbi:hypothetical protein BC937DRAFT_92003 [Endogone sp. FLAS-F59071]|nr:hypothetical protein BC937DRAFT_92003 [Endogone sp. FLAS-F59071]|eukprot:RUS15779.1 hypothetical protein BC937DRAFT_92003 [Endogone sp. FLAS-F59071]